MGQSTPPRSEGSHTPPSRESTPNAPQIIENSSLSSIPLRPFTQPSESTSDPISNVASNRGQETTRVDDLKEGERPEHAFFSPEFQTALKKGIKITERAAIALEKVMTSLEQDDHLRRLSDDAKRAGRFNPSGTQTVAFLGDSGEGKTFHDMSGHTDLSLYREKQCY